jgi:hypothetical protein
MSEQDLDALAEALRVAQAAKAVDTLAYGDPIPARSDIGTTGERTLASPNATAQRVKGEMQRALDEDIAALDALVKAIDQTKQALIAHHAKFTEHADNTAQLRTNAHQMVQVIGVSLEGFTAKLNGEH